MIQTLQGLLVKILKGVFFSILIFFVFSCQQNGDKSNNSSYCSKVLTIDSLGNKKVPRFYIKDAENQTIKSFKKDTSYLVSLFLENLELENFKIFSGNKNLNIKKLQGNKYEFSVSKFKDVKFSYGRKDNPIITDCGLILIADTNKCKTSFKYYFSKDDIRIFKIDTLLSQGFLIK